MNEPARPESEDGSATRQDTRATVARWSAAGGAGFVAATTVSFTLAAPFGLTLLLLSMAGCLLAITVTMASGSGAELTDFADRSLRALSRSGRPAREEGGP